MEVLEYSDILSEIKGYMVIGRLKLADQSIIYKNNKTGKVDNILIGDIDTLDFQRMVGSLGLRIFMKNGTLHRFYGLKESESTKISNFFKNNFQKHISEKELCVKGWNWGTAHFKGSVLDFDVDNKTTFEIPLHHVSQCTTGKNEVTLEFHQNDDAPVSLMEMRFHIPTSELADHDPVDSFYSNVMNKASVISVSGDAIAIFREIHCLTPRGRYDIKIFQTFFQLHGKTFDYKIPMSTVLRLFLLPHKDGRQMFFVLSLDPPIKQGQTRYHYLVLLFNNDEDTTIELPLSDEELKNKYEGKLMREISGPIYEVLGKVMKALINRKITGPGNFVGHSQTPAISCSFKAAAGYIYPLERGFMYVHKPPIHIRFEEISAVNFARSGGSTRSFDFEIELKSGTIYTFSSIEKEEYTKLYDFIISKKLHVKNTGKTDKTNYKDDFGDSDNENEPDAYLARVKAEARERDSLLEDGSDEESTDEDFNPNEQESDVPDEYDSNVDSQSSDESGNQKSTILEVGKHKDKKAKLRKSGAQNNSGIKKKKDDNKPKRPNTAFILWLNENRERIKKQYPGIKLTEISKKAGELWKELQDKSEWEQKANKEKEKYREAIKDYENSESKLNADVEINKKKDMSLKKSTMSGTGYKSKEYISDDSSNSEGYENQLKEPALQ